MRNADAPTMVAPEVAATAAAAATAVEAPAAETSTVTEETLASAAGGTKGLPPFTALPAATTAFAAVWSMIPAETIDVTRAASSAMATASTCWKESEIAALEDL